MSKTKWTPGPWHVGGVFFPGTARVHCSIWSAASPGCASGDEVATYVHPRDANLIAAAPALYEALAAVLDITRRPGIDAIETSLRISLMLVQIDKALAAARGES